MIYTVDSRLPYNQEYSYRFIRPVRRSRNKNPHQFDNFTGVDHRTIYCKVRKSAISRYSGSYFKHGRALKMLKKRMLSLSESLKHIK